MQGFGRYRIHIILLIGLALVIRLAVWYAYVQQPGAFVQPDTVTYLEPGEQLLDAGTFQSFARTPVYPIFLAVVSKAVSSNPALIALVHIGVSLATLALTFYLTGSIFGVGTGLVVLFFLATDLTSAISSNQLLADTLFTFLLTASIVALFEVSGKDTGLVEMAAVGVGVSLVAFCRPIGVFLFVPIAVWLGVTRARRRSRWLPHVGVFVVGSLLLPLMWVVRNYVHTEQLFFSTTASINLYEYRAAWNTARLNGLSLDQVQAEFRQNRDQVRRENGMNDGEIAGWMGSEAIRILAEHPFLTFRQGLEGVVKLYLGISNADINKLAPREARPARERTPGSLAAVIRNSVGELIGTEGAVWITGVKIWAMFYLALLYLGVLVAIVGLLRGQGPEGGVVALLVVVVGYFTLLSMGAESYARFRVPISPGLCVLAGLGWMTLYDHFRTLQQHRTEWDKKGNVGKA